MAFLFASFQLVVNHLLLLWLALVLPCVRSRDGDTNLPLPSGQRGLCVLGCSPYVDPTRNNVGWEKYEQLVEEMARTCDAIVHVGDTKAGKAPCNTTLLTPSIHTLIEAGQRHQTLVLYAPGDNELNDCHRHQSAPEDRRQPSEIVRAIDARQFLVEDLHVNSGKDLTGRYDVEPHLKTEDNLATCPPGSAETCRPYSCDFDKYVEFGDFAVATLEVIGSHWYLDDERFDPVSRHFPYQDEVDPLESRLALYVNAKDCAVEWIAETARRANASGKRALFWMFHATFYHKNGVRAMPSGAIGTYYNRTNLKRLTTALGNPVERPFYPLFDALQEASLAYPDLMFQVVHSDGHRYLSTRLLPQLNNGPHVNRTHHNLMLHQVEGASRAVTMYSRFTVHPEKFQPVNLKQEWSEAAMRTVPYGHAFVPYS